MKNLLPLCLGLLTLPSVTFAESSSESRTRSDYIKIVDQRPPLTTADKMRIRAMADKVEKTEPPAPLEDTFTLHSNPTASKVIYLDFDGHSVIWRGADWVYVPFSMDDDDSTFSDTELTVIQLAWQSISEDFLPFDLDVTTEYPGQDALMNTGGGDTEWGIRAVVSHNDGSASWAYVGSFSDSEDTELYAFAGNYLDDMYETWLWISDSVNHEAGHALGLGHDGITTVPGEDYYTGHGEGITAWAPIMGWTNYGISQWSKGEYTNADNQEDDLAIITSQNGFTYRLDDHGSTLETATNVVLDVTLEDDFFLPSEVEGIITETADIDFFSFTTTQDANRTIDISPDSINPNIDIEAHLYDASGNILASSNPADSLGAGFSLFLTTGDYYLSIDGVGYDDPDSDGYSDYASLGYYSVLFTNTDAISTTGTGETGETGETGDVDTATTTTTTSDTAGTDSAVLSGDSESTSSCGCSTGSAPWAGFLLLLPLLAQRRRVDL
jgi:serralysin